MSVLRDSRRGTCTRHILVLIAFAFVGCQIFGGGQIWAQDDAEVQAENDLWSAVTERYEVVVLSRGLLLEPLDDSVELVTIEIIDDSVAIDGESMDASQLAEKVGDESASLILQLAAMDRTQRREIFTGGQEAPLTDTVEETAADEADEADETERVESQDRDHRKYRDSQIVVGNSLTVDEDEVANEAVVFGGPLVVRGKVAGDAVAIGGSVTISGEVTGDAAAVGGDLKVEAGAEVLGDAVSVGGEVDIDDDANVRGQVIEVPFGPNLRFGAWPRVLFGRGHSWDSGDDYFELTPWGMATDFMWEAFKLIVLGLFACLVMLVAKDPLERVKRRAGEDFWKSGLVGLLVQILFAPLLVLVTLILVISVIGIPLVLLVPFFVLALILVAFLGYSGVAYGIGEFLQKRFGWKIESPYLVLLLGVLTIQIWSVIGDLLDFGWGPLWFFAVMFGVFGVLIKYLVWTVGLGAAVLSRFGTARGWGDQGGAVPSLPEPPAPVEPEPTVPLAPETPSVLRDLGFETPETKGEDDDSPL